MSEVVLIDDVFNPAGAKAYPYSGRIIDWLTTHLPPDDLRGRRIAVARENGNQVVPLAEWDLIPQERERIFIIVTPADPATTGLILTKIVISLMVSIALQALNSILFPAPAKPAHEGAPKPSPVYSLSVPRNAARPGEPIAVVYGRRLTVPDLAAQPYREFSGNEQFVSALFCLTMGECDVKEVRAGNTALDALPDGVAEWWVYPPAAHGRTHGAIAADCGVHEDMVTSPDVTGVEVMSRDAANEEQRPVDFLAPDTIRVYTSPDGADKYLDAVGGSITISGSASNNGVHTIAGVTEVSGLYVDIDVSSGITAEAANYVTRGTFAEIDDASVLGEIQLYTFRETPPNTAMNIAIGDFIRVTPTTGNVQLAEVSSYTYYNDFNDRTGVNNGVHILRLKNVSGGMNKNPGAPVSIDKLTNPITLALGDVKQWAGWFMADRVGVERITALHFDLEWPAGLYKANASTGALESDSVTLRLQYQQVDSSGDPIAGTSTTVDLTVATTDILTGDKADDPLNTPLRLTHTIPVPEAGYRVRMRRESAVSTEAADQSRTLWTGLRAERAMLATPVYDDATMMAVRLKATQGLSSEAIGRISAEVHRRLPTIASPLNGNIGLSRSPARAAFDILTNTSYGLGIAPETLLDASEFSTARAIWAAADLHFDHVFTDTMSVWSALRLALQPALAEPRLYGGRVGIVHGGPQITQAMVFSPANVLPRSLRVRPNFGMIGDPDGYRVAYFQRDTQLESEALWPPTAVIPTEVKLAGVTDAAVALDYAKIKWEQRRRGQMVVSFTTELEGRIIRRGDRIGLSWPVFGWGDVALLSGASGLLLTLDRDVPAGPSARWVVLRNDDGSPTAPIAATVTGVAQITLDAAPGISLYGIDADREPTHVMFGTDAGFLLDLVVDDIDVSDDGSARVTCRTYIADLWDGTVFSGIGV